jgi:competence protein ComEA
MKTVLSAVACAVLAFSSISSFAADAPAKASAAPVTTPAAKPAAVASQEAVNINTADAQALTKLKGVGAKKAEAIVAYRKANGAFKTVDQLAEVKGIGAKTVEANRKNIRI